MNDITVKPEITKGIKALTKFANDVEVKSSEDASDAGIKLYQISELKKTVEDQRTEITKPLNLSLRSINSFFKKFSEPLDTIDKQIRAKIADFATGTDETAFGVIHLKKNQVIEIVDEAKIPSKYFSIDMPKIMADIKKDIKIPGVKVAYKKTVSL